MTDFKVDSEGSAAATCNVCKLGFIHDELHSSLWIWYTTLTKTLMQLLTKDMLRNKEKFLTERQNVKKIKTKTARQVALDDHSLSAVANIRFPSLLKQLNFPSPRYFTNTASCTQMSAFGFTPQTYEVCLSDDLQCATLHVQHLSRSHNAKKVCD